MSPCLGFEDAPDAAAAKPLGVYAFAHAKPWAWCVEAQSIRLLTVTPWRRCSTGCRHWACRTRPRCPGARPRLRGTLTAHASSSIRVPAPSTCLMRAREQQAQLARSSLASKCRHAHAPKGLRCFACVYAQRCATSARRWRACRWMASARRTWTRCCTSAAHTGAHAEFINQITCLRESLFDGQRGPQCPKILSAWHMQLQAQLCYRLLRCPLSCYFQHHPFPTLI